MTLFSLCVCLSPLSRFDSVLCSSPATPMCTFFNHIPSLINSGQSGLAIVVKQKRTYVVVYSARD